MEKTNIIVTKKEKGKIVTYERVKSKVHNEVYHLRKIKLYCNEAMPTEEELTRNIQQNKMREYKRMSQLRRPTRVISFTS